MALTTAELVQLVQALPVAWQTPMLVAMTGLRGRGMGADSRRLGCHVGALTIKRTLCDVDGELRRSTAEDRGVGAGRVRTGTAARRAEHPGHHGRCAAARGKGGPWSRLPRSSRGDGGPEFGYVEEADDPRRVLFTTPAGHPVSHGNFYGRVYRPTVAHLRPEGHRLHRPPLP